MQTVKLRGVCITFSRRKVFAHIAFLAFFLLVFLVLTPIDHLDFYTHNKQLLQFYESGYWRPNFLYYLIVAMASGFSQNMHLLSIVAAFIMASSVYAKWNITKQISHLFFGDQYFRHLPFAMLFVFSLPAAYNNWYFGQISPNQWHNSTTILLMPFALLLYFHAYNYIFEQNQKSQCNVLYLSILNVLIKPSFLFCLMPVMVFWVLYKGFSNKWIKKMWVFFPALLILSAQYLILYLPAFKSAAVLSGDEGGVSFSFLHVWQHYSDNILLSFLLSVAFPFTAVLFYGKVLFSSRLFLFTLALFVVGILIFACLTETGSRQFHCNFIWQAIVANYLLYWVSAQLFLRHTLKTKNANKMNFWNIARFYAKSKNYSALAVYIMFLLQCLGGVYYLLRMVLRNGSYA